MLLSGSTAIALYIGFGSRIVRNGARSVSTGRRSPAAAPAVLDCCCLTAIRFGGALTAAIKLSAPDGFSHHSPISGSRYTDTNRSSPITLVCRAPSCATLLSPDRISCVVAPSTTIRPNNRIILELLHSRTLAISPSVLLVRNWFNLPTNHGASR